MGNEMKNVARGFKFLWATFSKTMGNVFLRHGQCFLLLSVGYPWVAPVGFTYGCVLVTALRFVLGCIRMCARVLAGIDPQSHTRSI